MENRDIARLLRETADLMEIAADEPHRIRSYRRAAETVAAAPPIASLAANPKQLQELPGIGPKLSEALQQIVATGSLPLHQQLLERYQPGMLQLLHVQGLGPKTISLIWERYRAATIEAVEALARSGQLRGLPRMSEKKEAHLLAALATYRRISGRFLRSTAARAAGAIASALGNQVRRMEIAGSLRRGCETVGGLDLAAAAEPDRREAALAAFAALPGVVSVTGRQAHYAEVQWADGGEAGITLPVRLCISAPEDFGALWLRTTGPSAHWILLQQRAALQGKSLGPSAELARSPLAAESEAAIYQALALGWIPPELRDQPDIISRAEGGFPLLPDGLAHGLVAKSDIRADLHMHTVETDGRATIEEMAEAALARGYRAIAITDHSQALAMARGMNEERALAHIARIRAADRAMGGRLRIFSGAEVDILADGRLDLADEVLAQMDVVIASVHSKFEQPATEITARLLRAIANPYTRILGHPTGRRLLRREPIAMNLDAVASACAAAGVVMEINASPERLDLNADLARAAARRGARFSIDTDAHHPSHLDFIVHGIAVARRAEIGPSQVINTLDPEALLKAMRPKPSHPA